MLLSVLSWLCSSLLLPLLTVSGGKLPEAEVTIEVLHRPFICHRKSKYGDILLVHHEGYFENGTMFHTSRTEGDKHAVWFTLGIREVIKGWDKGLQDMCSGEKRKLIVPPALAYGKEGKGTVALSVHSMYASLHEDLKFIIAYIIYLCMAYLSVFFWMAFVGFLP
ncbi:Peptidyl-prolyl cis-trans isomerase FKBP14 [Xyrichtys novacula]|uniref:peptidylprolyl isomerase n=1 Tax=Xyrichtys novacula TaxID=13765 RepID=A0AAV1HE89_XYRNO|nr:Peptidyl-prolyl cis-trans isomerase FKBP14 [Xyrichtys novacula]